MPKRAAALRNRAVETLASEPAATTPFPLDLPTADTMVQATDAFAKVWLEWQQEVARFAMARLQADMQLPASLAGCRDFAEAVNVQQKWLADTFQDYAGEAERLMEITSAAARDGMTRWRDAEPAATRDVADSAQVIK